MVLGTYSVVVNDNNGCNTSETVVITEADSLTSSLLLQIGMVLRYSVMSDNGEIVLVY